MKSFGTLAAIALGAASVFAQGPSPTGFVTSTATLDLSSVATPSRTLAGPTPTTCTGDSTLKTTTDCTYGHTYSYCYSEPPPVTCGPGLYPREGSGRCYVYTFCASVPTTTSSCTTGGFTPSSYKVFDGTLAGETTATQIYEVYCSCSGGVQSYYPAKTTVLDGGSTSTVATGQSYCLPTHINDDGDCPSFMTSSVNSWTYTLSSTVGSSAISYCGCPDAKTPIYDGAQPTGCV